MTMRRGGLDVLTPSAAHGRGATPWGLTPDEHDAVYDGVTQLVETAGGGRGAFDIIKCKRPDHFERMSTSHTTLAHQVGKPGKTNVRSVN